MSLTYGGLDSKRMRKLNGIVLCDLHFKVYKSKSKRLTILCLITVLLTGDTVVMSFQRPQKYLSRKINPFKLRRDEKTRRN
jgi:hypothetical protein